MIETNTMLDPVVDRMLQALRELECDNDETTNSMEYNIKYIVLKVMNEVYTDNIDKYTAMGLLESMTSEWFNSKFNHALKFI